MSQEDHPQSNPGENPGMGGSATIAPEPSMFNLPKNFITKAHWTRTELHFKGRFSGGCWVRDDEGRLAVKKPGKPRGGGTTEAFREFICAILAGWLGVNVPPVLLLEDPDIGPCSICPHVAGTALRYADIMLLPTFMHLRTPATEALVGYIGRAIVLDAWVGAEDRGNDLNHIFVEETKEWHSLDYGLSFHAKDAVRGVGDKDTPFVQPYLSDIREAARLSRDVIQGTIKRAKQIPEDIIKALVALPPDAFATPAERRDTVAFLVHRQSLLEQIVEKWWSNVGLPGAIKR